MPLFFITSHSEPDTRLSAPANRVTIRTQPKDNMNLRIPLAVVLIAVAGTLTSCTLGNENAATPNTGVTGNNPTGAPAETPTPEPTETETVMPEAEAAPLPAAPEGPGAASDPQGFTPGQPIPDAELAGSPTAKQMRFIAARLDAVLAGGVPADWAPRLQEGNVELTEAEGRDCWSYIAVIYTQAEQDAWNNDIQTPYMCYADGSYKLSGWSQSGSDPKYHDFNSSLEYESGKGFVTG